MQCIKADTEESQSWVSWNNTQEKKPLLKGETKGCLGGSVG